MLLTGKRGRKRLVNTEVVAIVCAHNEEQRIRRVLRCLTSYGGFAKIIVVDDGSSDKTSDIAGRFAVEIIRIPSNVGKGNALVAGVLAAPAETKFFFFCDADIRRLTHRAIDELLHPVISGSTDMMIAVRDRGLLTFVSMLPFVPHLGGERVLTRTIWMLVPLKFKQGFKIEAALNFYAKRIGLGFGYKKIVGLTQATKEKKCGWRRGTVARARMSMDVLSSYLELWFSALSTG